jgi:pimeloyl-ACP methyl ester carboxylesterase
LNRLIAHAICFAAILPPYAQQINKMEKPISSGHAPVNGIQMYYEVYGKGSIPLVLIHGGGSTIQSTFGNMIPILSRQYKIIAVELQAHGRTSDRDAPESFEQDADDVAALLKWLKVDKANFFGFSNGGTTSLQIGIRHPEIVNKLVVVSANSKREGMIAGFFEGMEHATIDNMPVPLKEAYLKVAPNKDNLIVMFTKDRDRMRNYKDIPDDALRSIKVPTLLLAGDKDVVTPEHLVQMSKLIPNTRLAIVPGDHGSFIGEICAKKESKMIEATATIITDFLNK